MRKTDLFEYTIGQHFLPYLINGDATGLSDTDCEEVQAFENEAFASAKRFGATSAHWAELTECTAWRKCEVSGYYGECSDIGLIMLLPEGGPESPLMHNDYDS